MSAETGTDLDHSMLQVMQMASDNEVVRLKIDIKMK
jgi:hypothetical protein